MWSGHRSGDLRQDAEDQQRRPGHGRRPQEEVKGESAVGVRSMLADHAVETLEDPIRLRRRALDIIERMF